MSPEQQIRCEGPYRTNDSSKAYSLYIGDAKHPLALLTYWMEYDRANHGEVWYMDYITSDIPGGGKSLIKEFCTKIGKKQHVYGVVTEPTTVGYLEKQGFIQQAVQTRHSISIPGDVYPQMKVWRVLHGGGLQNIAFTLQFESNDTNMETVLRFEANT